MLELVDGVDAFVPADAAGLGDESVVCTLQVWVGADCGDLVLVCGGEKAVPGHLPQQSGVVTYKRYNSASCQKCIASNLWTSMHKIKELEEEYRSFRL